VFGDAGRNQRMRELEKHCPQPGNQQQTLSVDAPRYV
jgi:hypothetical protein